VNQNTNGAISWADVAQAHEEWEASHHCHVEYAIHCYRPFRTSQRPIWSVAAFARWRPNTPDELRGWGGCQLGGSRGAATMPGCILRAMMLACEDLEKRRADRAYDRDTPAPRLPGF
jgi:hypothetical protein